MDDLNLTATNLEGKIEGCDVTIEKVVMTSFITWRYTVKKDRLHCCGTAPTRSFATHLATITASAFAKGDPET